MPHLERKLPHPVSQEMPKNAYQNKYSITIKEGCMEMRRSLSKNKEEKIYMKRKVNNNSHIIPYKKKVEVSPVKVSSNKSLAPLKINETPVDKQKPMFLL